jgi:hypothetical protein
MMQQHCWSRLLIRRRSTYACRAGSVNDAAGVGPNESFVLVAEASPPPDVSDPPVANMPNMWAAPNAIASNPITITRILCEGMEDALGSALPAAGRSATNRLAIIVASGSDHRLVGMFAIVRARLSIAADFGNPANLRASRHGSSPAKAKTDTGVSAIPFSSVPTDAKRNGFKPECCNANTSETGIIYYLSGIRQ